MGYTHYWRKAPELEETTFKMFAEDCDQIAHYAWQTEDIGLANWDGIGYPDFTQDVVCFNGLSSKNEDCETFRFTRIEDKKHVDEDTGLVFDCTKTACYPYDCIVTACLICAKHYFKDKVYISSDGELENWTKGFIMASAVIGNLGEAVNTLFDKPSEELKRAYREKIREENRIKNIGKPAPCSIPPKEVAKLVRAELKKAFPGQKFSVTTRNYNVVDVNWTNGPSSKKVQELVGHYKAGNFDGMDDSYHTDGSPYANKYIFFQRSIDHALYVKEAHRFAKEWGVSLPEDLDYNNVYNALWTEGHKIGTDLQHFFSQEISQTDY